MCVTWTDRVGYNVFKLDKKKLIWVNTGNTNALVLLCLVDS